MQNKFKVYFILLLFISKGHAQNLSVPKDIGTHHPRVFGKDMSLDKVKKLVEKEEWASAIIKNTTSSLAPYINHYRKDETWLVSRLQMYWKTKSTQVYINGGSYDHADGNAPVPTVRYPGARSHSTDYLTPEIENILPYMDDVRGLYLQHKDRKGQWEWTGISKTGKIVENINRQIMGIARDASFMYWYTGDKIYADLAYSVLNTYLQGVNCLKEPIDLSRGHHQTLTGYTSFEVIQEHILNEISQSYDFLYGYIEKYHPDNIGQYAQTLQKWADLIIKNGVSFNNWNLLQAAHVSHIALVLENDRVYKNGRGAQFYLDEIMNQSSSRQWSMDKLIQYGYDKQTGVWNESPGYSMNVLNDFISFAEFYDRNFDIDLIREIPVLRQAVISSVQYLYPNKYMVCFGDGHYSELRREPLLYMIENAQKYRKKDDEDYFTKMYKTIYADEDQEKIRGKNIEDLFSETLLTFNDKIQTGKLTDYTKPLFYVPHNSWLVQRQGEGDSALMISQIGSLGNHMHSNGIAIELYGRGLPLAPEMGHGSSYFSIEYAEYYTQFPAHNTVIVNGKSKYPEMKSNHGFNLNASYPKNGIDKGVLPGITFSDVSFLEPETNSNQRRVTGIVKNSSDEGYYIDIFRSVQNTGDNIKNEYFFHNLGQNLQLTSGDGTPLKLNPTEKLSFGDGDLMAYDYLWNKKSIVSSEDFKGRFELVLKDKTINMNLWMQGQADREIFSVLSPKSTAFRHGLLSDEISNSPIPALVVRQGGEAWKRPFVAIYEPALNNESAIQAVDFFGGKEFVGIHVANKSGQEDFIFSNTVSDNTLSRGLFSVTGSYGVISTKGNDFTLFLGQGKSISNGGYRIDLAGESGSAVLKSVKEGIYLGTDTEAVLKIYVEERIKEAVLTDASGSEHQGYYNKKEKSASFKLPVMAYQRNTLKLR